MPNLLDRRPGRLRGPASLALALTLLGLAASDAPAQHGGWLEARNQAFYGPDYNPRGYADALGLQGLQRCENGGYYGPPQIYSRQYGRIYGYRTARPFTPPRPFGGTGYGGPPSY